MAKSVTKRWQGTRQGSMQVKQQVTTCVCCISKKESKQESEVVTKKLSTQEKQQGTKFRLKHLIN